MFIVKNILIGVPHQTPGNGSPVRVQQPVKNKQPANSKKEET